MLNKSSLTKAKQTLLNNGIICYPTEAVWGLGCHPQSASAFARILQIKNRPNDKGVILVASALEQLMPYANIDSELQQQLAAIWPGFITCLLPKSAQCPDYLSGKHNCIAARLTTHPAVTALCQSVDSPLVSTSANVSGQAPIQNLSEGKRLFAHQVDYYVDAALGGKKRPSRIIKFQQNNEVIIRE